MYVYHGQIMYSEERCVFPFRFVSVHSVAQRSLYDHDRSKRIFSTTYILRSTQGVGILERTKYSNWRSKARKDNQISKLLFLISVILTFQFLLLRIFLPAETFKIDRLIQSTLYTLFQTVDCHLLATMMVLELPPRLSLSSQVSTESRYGMNTCFRCLPFSDTSAKGERKKKTL